MPFYRTKGQGSVWDSNHHVGSLDHYGHVACFSESQFLNSLDGDRSHYALAGDVNLNVGDGRSLPDPSHLSTELISGA